MSRMRSMVLAATLMALASPPAFAITATVSGVKSTGEGSKVTTADTGCDGHGAQSQWIRTGSSSVYKITNGNGCNTSLDYMTGGTVTHIKACSVRTAAPDVCSGWKP